MKNYLKLLLLMTFLSSATLLQAAESANIIVDKNATADNITIFNTIQAAVSSIPAGNTTWKTILVKNGTYNEHIFIHNSFIALVGESRANTIVSFDLDRDKWNTFTGTTNTGSGVINIGCTAPDAVTKKMTKMMTTDIFIGNMTIINSTSGKYCHAVRSELDNSNRITIVHCNVWANNSDTLALWNSTGGMYYHASNHYKGGIDAVCPRGWCYDIESEYVQTASSAPIWHEGKVGSGQKFVIRNAYIRPSGTNNIALVNGQKESTIYLLDCKLANRVTKQNPVFAIYYWNTKMEAGIPANEVWLTDAIATNPLSKAPGAPSQKQVTAAWTFNNAWDIENTMPAVLPYAAIPQPWNKAYDVDAAPTLKWSNARNATAYNVYFGNTTSPALATNTADRTFAPGTLAAGTYYWRVDAVTADGVVAGTEWQFTVGGTSGIRNCKATCANTVDCSYNNGEITLAYVQKASEKVTAQLVGISGQRIVLFENRVDAGYQLQTISLNGMNLAQGTYVVQLMSESAIQTAKFVYTK